MKQEAMLMDGSNAKIQIYDLYESPDKNLSGLCYLYKNRSVSRL